MFLNRGTVGCTLEAAIGGGSAHTNMVHLQIDEKTGNRLKKTAAEHGLGSSSRSGIRMMTHLDVSEADIHRAAAIITEALAA